MTKKVIDRFLLGLLLSIFFSCTSALFAEDHTSSSRFTIDQTNITIDTPGRKQKTSEVTILPPSDIQGFLDTGVYINHGEKNKRSASSLSLSLSPPTLDFDHLTAGSTYDQTIYFNIISSDHAGVGLFVGQDHPLTAANMRYIPGTRCNDTSPCTPEIPSKWIKDTFFGSGYTINALHASSSFSSSDIARPFGTISDGFIPMAISFSSISWQETGTIGMAVVVPPDQWEASYHQTIIVRMVPEIL